MILCHNGHPMQATHDYDCSQGDNGPVRSLGDVAVYCEEDCTSIPEATLALAVAYFTPRDEKTAWEFLDGKVLAIPYAGRAAQ